MFKKRRLKRAYLQAAKTNDWKTARDLAYRIGDRDLIRIASAGYALQLLASIEQDIGS